MSTGMRPSAWRTFRDCGARALLARAGEPSSEAFSNALRAEAAGRFGAALSVSRRLAAQGHADAQHHLAKMYDFGRRVNVNKRRAARLYRLAAGGGNVDAMFDMAVTYSDGDGVRPDPVQAQAYYTRAAEAGHDRAQSNLAMICWGGEHMPQDLERALRYFRMAAEQGNANAQYNYGRMRASGEGCEPDLAAAAEWHRRAARQRHPDAMCELAMICLNGEVESLSAGEGVRLLARGALRDHMLSMQMLSALYYGGKVVERDLVKAYGWGALALAAHMEDSDVDLGTMVTNLHKVRSEMSSSEIAQGRRFVLKRRGPNELLVLATLYRRWLGQDNDEEEGDRWLSLAIRNGTGTRRYLGMIPHDGPKPHWSARGLMRRLAGKRIFSETV